MASPPPPDRGVARGLTRSLCIVIVALMAAAAAYSAALALSYIGRIGV